MCKFTLKVKPLTGARRSAIVQVPTQKLRQKIMKKDLEKIRSILQKIEECPEPFISFMELENGNPDEFINDPEFVTAYSLIMDGQLICNRNGETSKNLGLIIYSPKSNSYQNSCILSCFEKRIFSKSN